jgi:hypothetical protein
VPFFVNPRQPLPKFGNQAAIKNSLRFGRVTWPIEA